MTTITTPIGIGTKRPGVAMLAILVALLALLGMVGARTLADSGSESPAPGAPAPATWTTPELSPAQEVQMFKAASSLPRGHVLSVAEEVRMMKAASSSPRTGLSVAEELQMLREASNG
jgi:hypothetical protein